MRRATPRGGAVLCEVFSRGGFAVPPPGFHGGESSRGGRAARIAKPIHIGRESAYLHERRSLPQARGATSMRLLTRRSTCRSGRSRALLASAPLPSTSNGGGQGARPSRP